MPLEVCGTVWDTAIMASLRKYKRSPYWYLRYRDLETGRWCEEATKLRHDDRKETRDARRLAEKRSVKEAQVAPDNTGEFRAWVSDYIANHYERASTHMRMTAAWEAISEWLNLRNLQHPRQVRYEHAQDFMHWRKGTAMHNTARLELKFLSFVLNEAIRREYCERNALAQAKIERQAPPEKPELSDNMMVKARQAFANEAPWMGVVFEIMAHIGCRFAESSIPMERIDFEKMILWIEDSKRKANDPKKLFAVPMTGQLTKILLPLRTRDRTIPRLTAEMNQRFNTVLKRTVGTTSHSLRVSFISRCHRAGLTEQQAMRLVNHSSRLVHRIYSRLNVEDARQAMQKVPLPPPPPDVIQNLLPNARSSYVRKKGNLSSSGN
jgi:hypothetical protein